MGVEEWKECTLSDLGTIVGGATPSTKDSSNYENGSIAWITPKDLSTYTERFISHGERNITEKGLKSCSAQLMPPNSILFTSRAPIGYIAGAKNEVCTNQGFKSIVPNKDTDFIFLYYLLRYNKDNIENLGSGTTFKEVSCSTMRNVPVKVPPLPTQQKIAAILSSLDDKIELNNKINTNLEQQAQALFKNWFVDFGPFGGKMPEGWKVGKLSDIADYYNGYAFSSKELLNEPGENCLDVFKQGHIKKGGGFIPDGTKSWYPLSKCQKLKNYILKKGDILMAMTDMKGNVAILGNTAIMPVDDKYIVNQRVGLLRAKKELNIDYPYLYLLTNDHDFLMDLRSRANSGVQVNLSSTAIKESEVNIAPKEVYKQFNDIILPLFEKILANQQENHKLANIRDTLLPKLMNGEIEV